MSECRREALVDEALQAIDGTKPHILTKLLMSMGCCSMADIEEIGDEDTERKNGTAVTRSRKQAARAGGGGGGDDDSAPHGTTSREAAVGLMQLGGEGGGEQRREPYDNSNADSPPTMKTRTSGDCETEMQTIQTQAIGEREVNEGAGARDEGSADAEVGGSITKGGAVGTKRAAMHRRLKPRRERKKVRFLDEIPDGNMGTDCGQAYPALDSEAARWAMVTVPSTSQAEEERSGSPGLGGSSGMIVVHERRGTTESDDGQASNGMIGVTLFWQFICGRGCGE
ncbi:uncharacterized protein LOC119276834 [Triticum dicoccoides]|uniref:uncharacterized protein LOC119276834 n=1 Tax=Triticum dicoccoides TaxID=85692 RepID=UPI00188F3636|nr:uncharacterized protein LOC119276834 [Triticum dicoccoides]